MNQSNNFDSGKGVLNSVAGAAASIQSFMLELEKNGTPEQKALIEKELGTNIPDQVRKMQADLEKAMHGFTNPK